MDNLSHLIVESKSWRVIKLRKSTFSLSFSSLTFTSSTFTSLLLSFLLILILKVDFSGKFNEGTTSVFRTFHSPEIYRVIRNKRNETKKRHPTNTFIGSSFVFVTHGIIEPCNCIVCVLEMFGTYFRTFGKFILASVDGFQPLFLYIFFFWNRIKL